ncbi:MAG TPA: hypothetical protein VHW71_06485 [Steroidobacteraceae bacterium]|nr:hypothetical protein [Steroidobacteraceae bacterium]
MQFQQILKSQALRNSLMNSSGVFLQRLNAEKALCDPDLNIALTKYPRCSPVNAPADRRRDPQNVNSIQEIDMETAKIDERESASDETPKIIEMGQVSEETKGVFEPGFENLMFPISQLEH